MPEQDPLFLIESNVSYYDQEEIYPNCTVQVLYNSVTGEYSVGWWRNDRDEEEEEGPQEAGAPFPEIP